MNISITNDCNRRCQYCFQKDWYLSKKMHTDFTEMSPETFEQLLFWFYDGSHHALPDLYFKLLGGEPLLHSEIFTLLNIVNSFKARTTIISNISIEEDKFKYLLDNYTIGPGACVDGFLVNSDYPDSQRDVFLHNYQNLCKTPVTFAISTTLLPGEKEVNEASERIGELIDIYKSIRYNTNTLRIRIAPYCPNPSKEAKFNFYNFSIDVANFFNNVWQHGMTEAGFDCPVNYCEFDESAIESFRNMGIQMNTSECNPPSGCPFDVLVDNSVIWCSSSNFIKLDDWREYRNYSDAMNAMAQKWREYWMSTSFKCDINGCGKFNPAQCRGVCAAKNRFIETKQMDNVISIKAE